MEENETKSVKKDNKRVLWIDVCKFLGIFAIFAGHFGGKIGMWENYFFSFHVPLFFFLSGCMFNYEKEENFFKYVIKKVKRILIPFYAFSSIWILISYVLNPSNSLKEGFLAILKGCIRNQTFSVSLWFFSCLFVIQVMFFLIKKVKKKYLMLLISLIIYFCVSYFIKPAPLFAPKLFFNIDSALYYLIFYAIGFVFYPVINKFFSNEKKISKIMFSILFIISAIFSLIVLKNKDMLFELTTKIMWLRIIMRLLRTLVLVFFILGLGKIFEKVDAFEKIGKETLFLCGNEYIVKKCVVCFLSIFGINLKFENALSVFIFVGLLLILCVYVIIPIEKKIVEAIKRSELFVRSK